MLARVKEKKGRRLCKRHGRGWASNRSGSRGGVGNAGKWDHKRTQHIFEQRAKSVRRATSIRDIESKLDSLLRKRVAQLKDNKIHFKCGALCTNYSKILSTGEPRAAYIFGCKHVRLSRFAGIKLRPL